LAVALAVVVDRKLAFTTVGVKPEARLPASGPEGASKVKLAPVNDPQVQGMSLAASG
jgi:hypothetical protein